MPFATNVNRNGQMSLIVLHVASTFVANIGTLKYSTVARATSMAYRTRRQTHVLRRESDQSLNHQSLQKNKTVFINKMRTQLGLEYFLMQPVLGNYCSTTSADTKNFSYNLCLLRSRPNFQALSPLLDLLVLGKAQSSKVL